MRIGTVRPEEARVFDSKEGYHEFHAEPVNVGDPAEPFGSFEVFWHDAAADLDADPEHDMPSGWYWAAGFPGCLWDGEPSGPFASSALAHEDADEWAPEYDPSEDD